MRNVNVIFYCDVGIVCLGLSKVSYAYIYMTDYLALVDVVSGGSLSRLKICYIHGIAN